MTEFLGTSYFYKDKIIGVCRGLSEPFIVGYHGKGGNHRVIYKVISPALPPCKNSKEAQNYLDLFAKNKGLAKAECKV